MTETEKLILENLLHNEEYARRVVPYIEEGYFQDRISKKIFSIMKGFIVEYRSLPSLEAIKIELSKGADISEDEHKSSNELIDSFKIPDLDNNEWLLRETENFCKDRAVYNAILESIHIMRYRIFYPKHCPCLLISLLDMIILRMSMIVTIFTIKLKLECHLI